MHRLSSVAVTADQESKEPVVIAGPGVRLGELYTRLAEGHGLTVPGGTCSTVGLGGLLLGGGWGVLGRA